MRSEDDDDDRGGLPAQPLVGTCGPVGTVREARSSRRVDMGVRMRLSIGLAVATVVGSVAMSVAPAAATPKVIVVGPGGVQAALNAAKPGDTVKLETGVYAEQMIV